ncbi:iron-containing alcohol dehydrogenase family protein [Rubrobacter indicoceani]|uniref:iron-containing alcohol dehydrogenase family protein n=1 Tax=Rubrobacter indicoceani TaxID=2051957 RepID=UPI000E5A768F|nr:iron-containing alcohol dehydrogenase [Rubrobacter indicoceani]
MMPRLSDRNLTLGLSMNATFGPGVAERTGEVVSSMSAKRAFVVTDAGIVRAGVHEPVVASLRKSGLAVEVFDGVEPNPSTENIESGSARLAGSAIESTVVVAVGGGSAMDAAKGIALHATNGGRAEEMGLGPAPERDGLPVVAVPTTAGTGSETNAFGVITSVESGRKFYVGHDSVKPRASILDPEMTVGLPPGPTAATGIDALSHALEAMMSKNGNPYADGLGLQATRMINEWLPGAVADGTDIEARSQMLLAAHLAGLSFASGTGLGLGHALAHPVGARLHAPHGEALASVLPAVMEFNRKVSGPKLALVSTVLGGDGEPEEAVRLVGELVRRVAGELPRYTVGGDEVERLIRDTLEDPVISNTPRPPSEGEVRNLLCATLVKVEPQGSGEPPLRRA